MAAALSEKLWSEKKIVRIVIFETIKKGSNNQLTLIVPPSGEKGQSGKDQCRGLPIGHRGCCRRERCGEVAVGKRKQLGSSFLKQKQCKQQSTHINCSPARREGAGWERSMPWSPT
jgi:hypothetical protein